jgi:tetratricopeptide (TPR) repeat protein
MNTTEQRSPPDWQGLCVCVFLALAVWAVFGQTAHFEFVNFDDDVYVYKNPQVTGGLSLEGMARTFTHAECSLYHPLTMISLMWDYHLHGLQAGGYHLTNVLIHTASVMLLFLILRRMTGAVWRSAFVAAVFAIHPLRVESVAWVTERKDVLGTFFFMLTVGAYVRYVEEGKMQNAKCRVYYAAAAGFFVLDLLSKPMAVTLPFVLLLLDYWPLHRFAPQTPTRPGGIPKGLILEKIPLMALAAAACVVTYFAAGKAVMSAALAPMPARIGNALVSCVVYLRQMVWPAELAVFYPYPGKSPPLWEWAPALLLLTVFSGVVLASWRKRPWLVTGWLWYLGMLVPVIGIVPIGSFAHADRNTYLPQIGLYVLLTWAAAGMTAGWRYRRLIQGGGCAAILGALSYCAHTQTSCWRNSELLWKHTLSCTTGNYPAHYNLGNEFVKQGRLDEAIGQFRKALDIQPASYDACYNLANALFRQGQLEDAIPQYRKALAIAPNNAEARNNLGNALAMKGDFEAAIAQYQKALQIQPGYADAHFDLGRVLLKQGQRDEAVAQFRKVVEIKPQDAEARNDLGRALLLKGEDKEAVDSWQQALEINPGQIAVLNNLAWLLATTSNAPLRNGAKAVALATQASQLSGGGNPVILRTLAVAWAEEGSYERAAATARRALALAVEQKKDELAATLQKEIQLYEAKTPPPNAPH